MKRENDHIGHKFMMFKRYILIKLNTTNSF